MSNSNKSPTDRAAINRQNARFSTGPRTDKGKEVSRLNAMRHPLWDPKAGTLCSQTVVSSKNNLVAYQSFTKRFFDDLQPKGIIEEQLTQTPADCSWRLNCARIYETNLLTLGSQEPAASVAIEDEDHEIQFALATAKSYLAQAKTLASISMHEHRVSREFHRSLKELREIQAERREHERLEMLQAAQLYKLHQEEQQAAQETAQSAAAGSTNEPTIRYDATTDALAHDSVASFLRMRKSKPISAVKTAKEQPVKLI